MSAYAASFLATKREEWKNSLGKWQWYENNAWHDAVINNIRVDGENIVAFIYCTNQNSSGTISQVRAFDTKGNVALSWNTSISRSSLQNVLLRVVLPIKEV